MGCKSFCFTALLLAASSAGAAVTAPEVEAAMQQAGAAGTVPVIVRLAGKMDLAELRDAAGRIPRADLAARLKSRAERVQAALLAFMHGNLGRDVVPLWLINGVAAKLRPGVIRALARWPEVASIRLDATLQAPVTSLAAPAPAGWNLDAVRAPELWAQGYDGAGAVVAGLDTGVDAGHPDLAGRWRGGGNSWFDPYGVHPTPYDRSGHGTQTMGLMVGGDAGGSSIGVAPGAQWIAAKIFNDAGVAQIGAIHLAFQWLLDPDGDSATDDAPHVVNGSWGMGNPNTCDVEFDDDIRMLKAASIFVAFAAGNDGPNAGTGVSPANNPAALAAGAVDDSLNIAGFSGRGPSACDGTLFPELVAPGVAVRTADLSLGGLANYATVQGTSFAAPHVAGVAALLRGAVAEKTVLETELALKLAARDLGPASPDGTYGYGLVDAVAAHNLLATGLDCPADGPDADADGIPDACDNCAAVANFDQRDSNGDGYGNLCDADMNNDGSVNVADMAAQRSRLGTSDGDADLNGDRGVNVADIAIMKGLFGKPPGPSGIAP